MEKTIFIEGMHCEHCTKAVTDALSALKGVTSVNVSLPENCAYVQITTATDAELKAAVEDIGFDVTSIK